MNVDSSNETTFSPFYGVQISDTVFGTPSGELLAAKVELVTNLISVSTPQILDDKFSTLGIEKYFSKKVNFLIKLYADIELGLISYR